MRGMARRNKSLSDKMLLQNKTFLSGYDWFVNLREGNSYLIGLFLKPVL